MGRRKKPAASKVVIVGPPDLRSLGEQFAEGYPMLTRLALEQDAHDVVVELRAKGFPWKQVYAEARKVLAKKGQYISERQVKRFYLAHAKHQSRY
jgi:hypothetical protein